MLKITCRLHSSNMKGKLIAIEGSVKDRVKHKYAILLSVQLNAELIGFSYDDLNQFDCNGMLYFSARQNTQTRIKDILEQGKDCIVYSYTHHRIARLLIKGGNKEWILEGEKNVIQPDIVHCLVNQKIKRFDRVLYGLLKKHKNWFKINQKWTDQLPQLPQEGSHT